MTVAVRGSVVSFAEQVKGTEFAPTSPRLSQVAVVVALREVPATAFSILYAILQTVAT